MRRAAKVDGNQKEITQALRKLGASVLHLHSLGSGAPDLLVGYRGRNILLECKDGRLVPSARRLTSFEAVWHETWKGQVNTVKSVSEAIEIVTGFPPAFHRAEV